MHLRAFPRRYQIQLLQHELAQGADEPNFVSAICRALEGSPSGSGGSGGRDRGEQGHGRQRGGVQGQQGPHRITEEFLSGGQMGCVSCREFVVLVFVLRLFSSPYSISSLLFFYRTPF